MVGLARQDLVGPVELLEQHDARELVREGQRPERQPVVPALQRDPERPADHEADVPARLPALLHERREALRLVCAAAAVEQADPRAFGDAPRERGVVAHLDLVDAGVPGEELRVVRDVVGVGRAQASHRQDRVAHRCDTTHA
jgi:hypothetical protein